MSICGGFSNDPFDVNNCTVAFNNCRTAEQIQIYIWQRIKEIQIFLNNFNQVQQETNNDHNTRITNNSNAIANIRNEVEALKKIANDLASQMTQTKNDVNVFKLKVDETLRLYQTSIDEIVKNVDILRSDNQALSHRVSVLEQQTDLNKLQQIIKTWQEINEQFKKHLEETKQQLIDYVNKTLTDNNIAINKRLDEFLKLINESNFNVEKLTLISLEHSKHLKQHDDEFNEINNRIDELAKDITKAYVDLVTKKVNEAVEYLNAVIERNEKKADNEYADVKTDLKLIEKELTIRINELSDIVDANNKQQNERIIGLHGEILDLIKSINRIDNDVKTAYDFSKKAFDYSKSASDTAKSLTNVVNNFIGEYNLKYTRLLESLTFINSDVIRHVFTKEDVGYWNIKIGVIHILKDSFNITSKNYLFVDKDNNVLVNVWRSIDTMKTYEEIKVINGESYDTYTLAIKQVGSDGDVEIRVKQNLNEFNKVYFEPVLVQNEDVDTIVDIDIHPFPEPPKPEPCEAIKVVLVDENCVPYRPKDGRDGRDGRDGDGVENIDIKVEGE